MFRRLIFLPALVFCFLPSAIAQDPPKRDGQALAILVQAVGAAGGPALSAVQDFTASGKITFYWAGQEVSGPVTMRGRGLTDFQLDADLPDGRLLLKTNGQTGSLLFPDSTNRSFTYHDVGKMGARTFYFPRIVAALSEPGVSISYLGQTTNGAPTLHRIEVDRKRSAGLPKNFTSFEFQIDPNKFLVMSVQDQLQPKDNANQNFSRVMAFADYRPVHGIMMPFVVTESVDGQRMWLVQLDSIKFNTGLSNSDFEP